MNPAYVKPLLTCLFVAGIFLFSGMQSAVAQRKTTEELNQIRAALVSPSQKGIDIDTLTEQEMQSATLQQEGTKGYILKNAAGITVRTLFDTDNDGQLDQWGFYKDGVEVYRDLDTDGDKIADQMRWINTGGTRWGVDTNKDGVIDSWKVISPEEVSEEVTLALATRDVNRFLRVALTSEEAKSLQCGAEMTQKLEAVVAQQQQAFQQAVQDIPLSADAQWVQFSALKPATIPAGTGGIAKDVTVYYNAVTAINDNGSSVYILLGSLVRLGDVWKIIEAPKPYTSENPPSVFTPEQSGGEAIPPEIQEKITEIQGLEEKLGATPQADRTPIYDRIIVLRLEVAMLYSSNKYKDTVNRDKWLRDLADFIYTAVTVDGYSTGISKLQTISKSMKDSNNHEVAAYMQFRTVEATYIAAQGGSASGAGIAYTNRIDGLKQLVSDFPDTTTAAQVQLELIDGYLMSNQLDEAREAAQAILSSHPNTLMAEKAAGFLSRMDAVGKEFPFQGTSSTGSAINVNQYKGKIVLLYFWASWSDPSGTEAAAMKRIQALYERDGLSIIGVNMDETAEAMQAYVTQHATKWPNIHEPGGQDSRPAVAAGVNVPPFFILIDKDGKVVNNQLLTPEDVDRAVFSFIRGE
ncbi:MAG: redoxin domain-containing protein [Planctomycetaceae bacterium]|nr:redoxin domain-containing protein [Planctomycetaceae bacterium]